MTLQHKYFVFSAGLTTKAPLWRLITHDINKLKLIELPNYGRQFFGDADDPEGFIQTWVHHQNHEDHHWEYWIPRTGHNRCTPPFPDGEPIPMPMDAVREMVADWLGAGRAYDGRWPTAESWPWFETHWKKIKPHLHKTTVARVEKVLREIGFEVVIYRAEEN